MFPGKPPGYKVPENLTALENSFKELGKQKEESIRNGEFTEASLIQKEQDEVKKKAGVGAEAV